jgi:hypothetical protein
VLHLREQRTRLGVVVLEHRVALAVERFLARDERLDAARDERERAVLVTLQPLGQ